MTKSDRIAIENAALVLRAVLMRAHENIEFARHLLTLPVPGGRPFQEFVSAIGATASRYPTDWATVQRRESEDAA